MKPAAGSRPAAVIGRPISQSLSPLIHNAWLEAAGIDAVYLAFAPSDEAELGAFLDALRRDGGPGVNITAPYKEAALTWAERNGATLEPEAASARSVNLLVLHGETPRAASTDGRGMIAAIREQAPGLDLAAGPAVVLGAGGAGRAAVHALLDEGVRDIRLVNRSIERAQGLAGAAGAGVTAWGLDDAAPAMEGSQLLINAASMMEPPDLSPMKAGSVVLDMTYRPLETPLLTQARARSLTPVDGLAMLIGQARPSFEALFGAPAPDIDVRALCLAALERAEGA